MSKKLEDITLRSDKVQEVLTKPPHWLIRFGNMMLLAFSFLLLFLSWFIKYPDVVESPLTIDWKNPPEIVQVTTTTTLTHLLVEPNEPVLKGQSLAIIGSSARYADVLALQSLLAESDFQTAAANFPIAKALNWSLGEVFPVFDEFAEAYITYKKQGAAPTSSLNGLQSFRAMKASMERLRSFLKQWETEHLLIASTSGMLQFETGLVEGQRLQSGQKLFSITPKEGSLLVGRMKVSGRSLYKLAEGQQVIISLERYPATEFGKTKGFISRISHIPDDKGLFEVEVKLPENQWSKQGRDIRLETQMGGTAEIITADLRLSDRLFQKVKSMFSAN